MISVKHLEHFMLLHSSIFEVQSVVTDSHTCGKQFCCEILHWLLEWQSLSKFIFTHLCLSLKCVDFHSNGCPYAILLLV